MSFWINNYHKLQWVDDFAQVENEILKFAPTVPVEKTEYYYEFFHEELQGHLAPTSSGHGSVDLIIPGCHKAAALERLVQRCGITTEQWSLLVTVEMILKCWSIVEKVTQWIMLQKMLKKRQIIFVLQCWRRGSCYIRSVVSKIISFFDNKYGSISSKITAWGDWADEIIGL